MHVSIESITKWMAAQSLVVLKKKKYVHCLITELWLLTLTRFWNSLEKECHRNHKRTAKNKNSSNTI